MVNILRILYISWQTKLLQITLLPFVFAKPFQSMIIQCINHCTCVCVTVLKTQNCSFICEEEIFKKSNLISLVWKLSARPLNFLNFTVFFPKIF